VLRNLPFLHRVGAITKTRAPLLGRFSRQRYDLAFIYGNDRPLVEYALRIARRSIAFDQSDPDVNHRLYRAVELPPHQRLHAVRYRLALLAPSGSRRKASRFLIVSPTPKTAGPGIGCARSLHRAPAARRLAGCELPTKAYRDWPIEHFIELSRRIRSRHPAAHFLIFGGKLERDRTLRLHEQTRGHSTHYAGA
jgi:heptosyltransferase-3